MAALSYRLEFAGIPFVNDDARAYQMNKPDGASRGPRASPSQRQGEVWLWDEIEREIPTHYLLDMECGRNVMPDRIQQLAARKGRRDVPRHPVRLGDFYYPVGASRWSTFYGLATATAAKAMVQATLGYLDGARAGTFVMSATPQAAGRPVTGYGVTTEMYMLPPRPLSETAGAEGLYLVCLVDERYFWQFTGCTIHPDYGPWQGYLDQIGIELGVDFSLRSGYHPVFNGPEVDSEFWVNNEDVGLLLDAIAHNVGRRIVRHYDGTYELLTPVESVATATANRGTQNGLRLAGGTCYFSGPYGGAPDQTRQFLTPRNILPESVTVQFPVWTYNTEIGNWFSHRPYASTRYRQSYEAVYETNIPIRSGGPLVSGILYGSPCTLFIQDTAKAVYGTFVDQDHDPPLTFSPDYLAGDPPLNWPFGTFPVPVADDAAYSGAVLGLQTLSQQIAETYYGWAAGSGLDEVYLGTLTWTPEGLHDLLFTWSAREGLATTRVMRAEFTDRVTDYQHTILPRPVSGGQGVYSGVFSGYTPYPVTTVESGRQHYLSFASGGNGSVNIVGTPATFNFADGITVNIVGGPTTVVNLDLPGITLLQPLTFNGAAITFNNSVTFNSTASFTITGLFSICGLWELCYVNMTMPNDGILPAIIKPVCRLNVAHTGASLDTIRHVAGFENRNLRYLIINVGSAPLTVKRLAGLHLMSLETGSGGDFTLLPEQSFEIWYDTVTLTWQVLRTPDAWRATGLNELGNAVDIGSVRRVHFLGGDFELLDLSENQVQVALASGYTGDRDVVEAVYCSGGTLTVTTCTWTFLNGRLMEVTC